jgi:hypothetical protein
MASGGFWSVSPPLSVTFTSLGGDHILVTVAVKCNLQGGDAVFAECFLNGTSLGPMAAETIPGSGSQAVMLVCDWYTLVPAGNNTIEIKFGENIGVTFSIQDPVLSVFACPASQ